MFTNLCGLIGFGLLIVPLPGATIDRLDQLFTSWEEAQRDAHSLVVEFTEVRDPARETRQKIEGTFKLLRTRKGKVFASYEDNEDTRHSGLLNGGTIYLLEHDTKTALKFEPANDDLLGFLEKYFSPFVLLLDRKRAQENCRLEITKQNERHTCLTIQPKQISKQGLAFHEGRAVLMNKRNDAVPKDMPKQLWYTNGENEYLFKIRAWRLNAADAPKLHEFKRPEDRAGWTVLKWD